jgi:hypothetical protein
MTDDSQTSLWKRPEHMLRNDWTKWMIFISISFLIACTQNRFPNLVIAEEAMVDTCDYLETISETSDPGKPITNYKYYKYYDGEMKVLERADNMGATHLVWLYNYPIGSSASAYRCGE